MSRPFPLRQAALMAVATLAAVPAVASAGAANAVEARVLVGLQRDTAGLESFAAQVSDPASSSYRAYATVPRLARKYGASDATVARVRAALRRAGLGRGILDVTRGFLVVPATGGQVQALKGSSAEMQASGPARADGMDDLKSGLGGVVTEILVGEPRLAPLARETQATPDIRWPINTGTARGCAQGAGTSIATPGTPGVPPGATVFTPNQFQTAFGMTPLHRSGIQGQGQHIALFEQGAGVKRSDLTVFARCFGLPDPRFRIVPVGQARPVDPVAGGGATVEATLDAQAVMQAAPRARITMVQGSPLASMPEVMSASLDARRMRGLPDVVSVSYGICEPLVQGGSQGPLLGGSASRRLTDWVMATGAGAGVSVLVATGDSGAQGCAHNVGGIPGGTGAPLGIAFSSTNFVGYPASSRWATAVGGTFMTLRRDNRIRTLTAWNDRVTMGVPPIVPAVENGTPVLSFPAGGGTGGSSMLYGLPAWQREFGIVSSRRLVPDVSMFAAYGVVMACSAWDPVANSGPCPPASASWPFMSVSGTSFAAPLLAGGVALANQRARSAGQANVGFLAPFMYGPGRSAVRDVTTGNNDVFGTGRCCFAGPGYDQATGLGTVNATRLANAVVRAGG